MKVNKISNDHYIIVDDSEIKEGDWIIDSLGIRQVTSCEGVKAVQDVNHIKKITHSTQPLDERGYWGKVMPLTLTISEIKELIGEVDVEKKAEESFPIISGTHPNINWDRSNLQEGFITGYLQALEDNKDKKYTEEDLRKMFVHGKQLGLTIAGAIRNGGDKPNQDMWFNESIESLQPKTEWEVEIVDGKLKLK